MGRDLLNSLIQQIENNKQMETNKWNMKNLESTCDRGSFKRLMTIVVLAGLALALHADSYLFDCGGGSYDDCTGLAPGCIGAACVKFTTPQFSSNRSPGIYCLTGGPWTVTGQMQEGECYAGFIFFPCSCQDLGASTPCGVNAYCV